MPQRLLLCLQRSTMMIWVGTREENPGRQRCSIRASVCQSTQYCCCSRCCGWCWCEVTWSVPHHPLGRQDRTAAQLCCTMDWCEDAATRLDLPVGSAPAGKAGGKGPGRVGRPLADWPLTPGCLLPPTPPGHFLSLTASLHHS